MFSIEPCPLPDEALRGKYVQNDNYSDCYQTEISGTVTQAQYVNALYTTLVFKIEKAILKWAVSKHSFDFQARGLAEGSIDKFAAWDVEGRCENQLLLSDFQGRTKSWLMALPTGGKNSKKSRLYFGSAVIPVQNFKTGEMTLGPVFTVLPGFHKIYSKALLYSAKSRLMRQLF